ncbi:MAG: TolC family protein [Desulfovibrio sp.]|nr:TolC family protein [Desulfovibrio sp.]
MPNNANSAAPAPKICFLGLALFFLFCLNACQRKAVSDTPWLQPPWNGSALQKQGESHARDDAPLPLPAEDTPLSFGESVLIAAQNAPDMKDGLINLQLSAISKEDAFWKRVPKIQSNFRVTTNITKQHKQYRDNIFRFGLGVYGFEPVVSYFASKAAVVMEDIALCTYQIALQKRAGEIAEAMLRAQSLETAKKYQKDLAAKAKGLTSYYRTQSRKADQLAVAKAVHEEKIVEAETDKLDAKISSLHLSLKLHMGLDLDRRIHLDTDSLTNLLDQDDAPNALAKNDENVVWEHSPEARIGKDSLTLRNYNIDIAWARYLPTVSFDVYSANPDDDYATYSSKDDIFSTLYFTLPLLDWGDRSRGVDRSRIEKLQATQRNKLNRSKFSQEWREAWQAVKIARADVELAREVLAVARLEEQKARLQYTSGAVDFTVLSEAEQEMIRKKIELEEATLELKLAELSTWLLSGKFRERFFEPLASLQ